MRRAVWFVGGVAAGATGVGYAKRKIRAAVNKLRPTNVAHSATSAVGRGVHHVTDAVREGVTAARRRERELKAQRDGLLVGVGDHLDEGDELLVDGEAVDSGRVVVLRRRGQR